MRMNRRFLYGGVFLVALGAILVAADLGALDLAVVRDGLRLWPVAIVVIGVALIARRSPIALPAGLLAASVPGLALGGALAIGPQFVADCAAPGPSRPASVQQGAFDSQGPRDVSIRARCGSFQMRVDPATAGWRLDIGEGTAPAPEVQAGRTLAVDAAGSTTGLSWGDRIALIGRGSAWDLALAPGDLGDISLVLASTESTVALAGGRANSVDVTATASRVTLDLSSSEVQTVSTTTTFGQLSLIVPANADVAGRLTITGASVRICTDSANGLAAAGLRVTGRGFADHVTIAGDGQRGGVIDYESPGYAAATHHADLRVNASFGSIEIDPIGGCR